MYVSYKWLEEFVDLSQETPQSLAEKITRSGIEVESVQAEGLEIKNVVVGKVQRCEQHPNADKLRLCQVDVGQEEPLQIVCGAPNVAAGQLVPVALAGAVLPNGLKIKKGKIRGEESNGMICSLEELGIDPKVVPKEFAAGIYVFPSDMEIGRDAIQALYFDDAVLELGLTPNRSDCMSMLGVAYEVAAILEQDVMIRSIEYDASSKKANDLLSIKIEDETACPLYVAKVVQDVKIGPSPLWMQACLIASGIRPHNNVVDITNFVLMEYGQPLHAFDYDKLGIREILVRMAKRGESIVTLDEEKRTLAADQLVITNGVEPVAIAGVMGGANSEVSAETTTVVIESAYFQSNSIRKTSRLHSLRSEASARFEKGVDPNRVLSAAERAAQLLAQFAGGKVAEGIVIAGELEVEEAKVTVDLGKINKVLGTDLSSDQVTSIFSRLQFSYEQEQETYTLTIPTRRGDITIPEDVIEEVARLYGYDEIPTSLPIGRTVTGGLTPYQLKRRKIRRYLEGVGLSQAVTYSLASEARTTWFALGKEQSIRLAMPMSEERSVLRTSLVPKLLEVIKYNLARQIDQMAIYEIGAVFLGKSEDDELPREREYLAGALTGVWQDGQWQGEKKYVDFFVIKGIVEGLLEKLAIKQQVQWRQIEMPELHPGQAAGIYLNHEQIGFVGQVHPNIAKHEDLKETYVFELTLDAILETQVKPIILKEIPKFPFVMRDIALVVDQAITAGDLEAVIKQAGGKLLQEVNLFDIYEGSHIEAGKKSLAYSLKYFDPNKTLTDEEVLRVHHKVLKQVKEKCDADLRG